MKKPLVQILMVVAIIQMRSLKSEVGKVSIRTVLVYGLVGPKDQRNCRKIVDMNVWALGFKFVCYSRSERESG